MKNFKLPLPGVHADLLETCSQAGQDLYAVAMCQGKQHGSFLEIGANHLKHGNNTWLLEKTFRWSGFSIDLENFHSDQNYQKAMRYFWSSYYDDIKQPSWPVNAESLETLPAELQHLVIQQHGYHERCPKRLTWHQDRPLTQFIEHDAVSLDYGFLPARLDYLQVDIDPPMANLAVLKMVLSRSTFGVITFEHDVWRNSPEAHEVRQQSRALLDQHGYELVVNDVTIEPGKGVGLGDAPIYFEDWYAHPSMIAPAVIECYRSVSDRLYPKYYTDILFA